MGKTTLLAHYSCSMQKRLQKTAIIGEIRPVKKLAKIAIKQRLYPLQNGPFGWKIKNA